MWNPEQDYNELMAILNMPAWLFVLFVGIGWLVYKVSGEGD